MICCDVCRKPPRTRGPGQAMFIISHASFYDRRIMISIEPAEDALRFGIRQESGTICGACLDKLQVPQLAAFIEAEQRRRNAEQAIDTKALPEGGRHLLNVGGQG